MDFRDLKVLCYADAANFPGLPGIFKGKGGLPMSAWQITAAKQRLGSEQVLLTRALNKGRTIDDVRILPVSPFHYFYPTRNIKKRKYRSHKSIIFPSELFSLGTRQLHSRSLAGYFRWLIIREDPSVIQIHQPRRSNLPIVQAAMLSGYPVVVTLHGLGLAEKEWPGWKQSESDRVFDKTMIEFLNREGVDITCVGEVIKNKIFSLLDIEDPGRIHSTKNGVNKDVFRFFSAREKKEIRAQMGIPHETRIIAAVGTLDRRKNLEFLIRAVPFINHKAFPDIKCWIIGDGRLRGSLSDMIACLGLEDKVKLLGENPPHEIARIFAASDLSVLVSHSEGLSRTVFESISTGTPVASFKDLFSENLAKEASSGLALSDRGNGDPEDFAEFLTHVLQREWDRADVAKASKGYSWDDVGRDYMEILSEVSERADSYRDI